MIGLIRLNTQFPRPIGDGGNPASWREPVLIHDWEAGRVENVVTRGPLSGGLLDRLVEQVNALADHGARCVTTSCGFLAMVQNEVAARVRVPFLPSSLSMIDVLEKAGIATPYIGVLTFDAELLGALHFAGVGAEMPVARAGLSTDAHLKQVVLQNETSLDLARAQAEVVGCARTLIVQFPLVKHLILECTNLAPYRAAIESQCGVRTYDIRDTVEQRCPM